MEIIKQVSERTGISEQQAAQAVAGISDQLRGNLPGGLGDALGGLLGGGAPAGGAQSVGLDDLLGGLLGGAQQGAGGQQGVGLDDLVGALGGILSGGQQGAAGQQGGFGLDDIIGMISGGGAQGNLNQGNVIQDISERAGISPEIAAAILPIVLEFLRDKLPPQLSDALGGILGTPNTNTRQGGDDGFGLDDIVGGLLGGNR
jgi:hypothetical protein